MPDDASDTTYFNQRNVMQGLTVSEVDLWPLRDSRTQLTATRNTLCRASLSQRWPVTVSQFLDLIWTMLVPWNLCGKHGQKCHTCAAEILLCVKIFSQKRSSRGICQEHLVVKRIYIQNIENQKLPIYIQYTYSNIINACRCPPNFHVVFWLTSVQLFISELVFWSNQNVPLCHYSPHKRLRHYFCAKIRCVSGKTQ